MGLPNLPFLRTVEGPIGTCIKEIRDFLQVIRNIKLLSGKEVNVKFTASDISLGTVKRVPTGLGYQPTGFFITRGHSGSTLIQLNVPTTEQDISVLYLKGLVAGTYTIWVY